MATKGNASKTHEKKDPVMEAAMKTVWLIRDQKGLPPLSRKKRPDNVDIEIMQRDREGLQLIVAAILANGRLASMIAHAWAEERSLYLIPHEEWDKAKTASLIA